MQSCLIVGWDAFPLDGLVGQRDLADVILLKVVAGRKCSLWRLARLTLPILGLGRRLGSLVRQDAAGTERHGAKHQE
jgi:hypothetical protein